MNAKHPSRAAGAPAPEGTAAPRGTGPYPGDRPRIPAGEVAVPAVASPAGPEQPGPAVGREESAAGPGDQPRSWVIDLTPGTPILSANSRLHRYARNRRTQDLKEQIRLLALNAGIPRLERADIEVLYFSPPRLVRQRHPLASDCITDHDNLAPTAKALVDGVVKAGVLRADTKRYVRSWCGLAEQTHDRGLVRVTITEVGEPQ